MLRDVRSRPRPASAGSVWGRGSPSLLPDIVDSTSIRSVSAGHQPRGVAICTVSSSNVQDRKQQLSLVPITCCTSAGRERVKRGLTRVGPPTSSTVPDPGDYTARNIAICAQDDLTSENRDTDINAQVQRLRQDLELTWELLRQAQKDLTRRDATVAHLSRTNDGLRRKLAALECVAHVSSKLVDKGISTQETESGLLSPKLRDSIVDGVSGKHVQHVCPDNLSWTSGVSPRRKSVPVECLKGSHRNSEGVLTSVAGLRQIQPEGKETQNSCHTWSEYRYTECSLEDCVEKTLSMEHLINKNGLPVEKENRLEKVCRCKAPSGSPTSIYNTICNDKMLDSQPATKVCQSRAGTTEHTAECLQESEPWKMHRRHSWHAHSSADVRCSHHSALSAEPRLADLAMDGQKTDFKGNVATECNTRIYENTQQHICTGADEAVANVEDAIGVGVKGNRNSVSVSEGRETERSNVGTEDTVVCFKEGSLVKNRQQQEDTGRSYRVEEFSSGETNTVAFTSDTRLESIVEEETLEVPLLPHTVCDLKGASAESFSAPFQGNDTAAEASGHKAHSQINIFEHHSHNVHSEIDTSCTDKVDMTLCSPMTDISGVSGVEGAAQNGNVAEGHEAIPAHVLKVKRSVSGSQEDDDGLQTEALMVSEGSPQHSNTFYDDLQRSAESNKRGHTEESRDSSNVELKQTRGLQKGNVHLGVDREVKNVVECTNGAASEADVHDSSVSSEVEGQYESALQGLAVHTEETTFLYSSCSGNFTLEANNIYQDTNNSIQVVGESATGEAPGMDVQRTRASQSLEEEGQDEGFTQKSTVHMEDTMLSRSSSSSSITHRTESLHHSVKDYNRETAATLKKDMQNHQVRASSASEKESFDDGLDGSVREPPMSTEETTFTCITYQGDSVHQNFNGGAEQTGEVGTGEVPVHCDDPDSNIEDLHRRSEFDSDKVNNIGAGGPVERDIVKHNVPRESSGDDICDGDVVDYGSCIQDIPLVQPLPNDDVAGTAEALNDHCKTYTEKVTDHRVKVEQKMVLGSREISQMSDDQEVRTSNLEVSVPQSSQLDNDLSIEGELTQGDLEIVHNTEGKVQFRADAASEGDPQIENIVQALEEKEYMVDDSGGSTLLTQEHSSLQFLPRCNSADEGEHSGRKSVEHCTDDINEVCSEASPGASREEGLHADSEDENTSETTVDRDKPYEGRVEFILDAVTDQNEHLCEENNNDAEEVTATALEVDIPLDAMSVALEQEGYHVGAASQPMAQGVPSDQSRPDDSRTSEETITSNLEEAVAAPSECTTDCGLDHQDEKSRKENTEADTESIPRRPYYPKGNTTTEIEINNQSVLGDVNNSVSESTKESAMHMRDLPLQVPLSADCNHHEEKDGSCVGPTSGRACLKADGVPGTSPECEEVEMLAANCKEPASHTGEEYPQQPSCGSLSFEEDVSHVTCAETVVVHDADSEVGRISEVLLTSEVPLADLDAYALGTSKGPFQQQLSTGYHDDEMELSVKDASDFDPAVEAISDGNEAMLEDDAEEDKAVETSHEEPLSKDHMKETFQQLLCVIESTPAQSLTEEVTSELDVSEEECVWEDEVDREKSDISPPPEENPAGNLTRSELSTEEPRQQSCNDHVVPHVQSSTEQAITEEHCVEAAPELEAEARLENEACSALQQLECLAGTLKSPMLDQGETASAAEISACRNLLSDRDGSCEQTFLAGEEEAEECSGEVVSEVEPQEEEPTASCPSSVNDNIGDETETLRSQPIRSDQEVTAEESVQESGTVHAACISTHTQKQPYQQSSSIDDLHDHTNTKAGRSHETNNDSAAATEVGKVERSLREPGDGCYVQTPSPVDASAVQTNNGQGTTSRGEANPEGDNLHFVGRSETSVQEGESCPTTKEFPEEPLEKAMSEKQCTTVQQSVLISDLTGQTEKRNEVTLNTDTDALQIEVEVQGETSPLPEKEECSTTNSKELLPSAQEEQHRPSLLRDYPTFGEGWLVVEHSNELADMGGSSEPATVMTTKEHVKDDTMLELKTPSTTGCSKYLRDYTEESSESVPSHGYDALEQNDPEIEEDALAVNPVLPPGQGTAFMPGSGDDVLQEHLSGCTQELSDVEQAICFYEDLLDVAQQNFTGAVESLLTTLQTTVQTDITKPACRCEKLGSDNSDNHVRENMASCNEGYLPRGRETLSDSMEKHLCTYTHRSEANILDGVTVEMSSNISQLHIVQSTKNEKGSSQQQEMSDACIVGNNSKDRFEDYEVQSGQNDFMVLHIRSSSGPLPTGMSHGSFYSEGLRMTKDECCRQDTFEEVTQSKRDSVQTGAMPRPGMCCSASAVRVDVGIEAGPEMHSQSVQTEFEDCSAKVTELHMVMSEREEVRRQDMRAACELLEKLEVVQLSEAILSDQVSDLEAERKELRCKVGRLQDELRAWQETVQHQQVLLQQMKDDMEHTEQMLATEKKETEGLRLRLLAFQDTLLCGKADKAVQTATDLFRIEGSQKWGSTEVDLALVGSQLARGAREASYTKHRHLTGPSSGFRKYLDNLEKRLAGGRAQAHERHAVRKNFAESRSSGGKDQWQATKGKVSHSSQTEEEKLSLLGARCLYENHPEIITRQANMLQQLLWAQHGDSSSPKDTARCSPSTRPREVSRGSTVSPRRVARGFHIRSPRSLADLLAMQNELEREMRDVRKTERQLHLTAKSVWNGKRG